MQSLAWGYCRIIVIIAATVAVACHRQPPPSTAPVARPDVPAASEEPPAAAEPAAPSAEPEPADAEGQGRLSVGDGMRRAPQVRLGNVAVQSGQEDIAVVKRALRQTFGRARLCYERALTREPQLEGSLGFRLSIERNGSASNIAKVGGSLGDPTFVGCVQEALGHATFEARERDPSVLMVPLLFAPGG